MVLGAVQPVEGGEPAGIRIRFSGAIQLPLEPGGHRFVGRLVGPRQTGGWHHPGPQLLDNLLPDLGVSAHLGRVERTEHEPTGLQALVMAADAIALDDRARRGEIDGLWCGCRLRGGRMPHAGALNRPRREGTREERDHDARRDDTARQIHGRILSLRPLSLPRTGGIVGQPMNVARGRALFLPLLACLTLGAAPGDPPLNEAVRKGDAVEARRILAQGADVNASAPDGTTPLHWAVHRDAVELVRLLIDAGADVKVGNRYGVTPLVLACTNGSTGGRRSAPRGRRGSEQRVRGRRNRAHDRGAHRQRRFSSACSSNTGPTSTGRRRGAGRRR